MKTQQFATGETASTFNHAVIAKMKREKPNMFLVAGVTLLLYALFNNWDTVKKFIITLIRDL